MRKSLAIIMSLGVILSSLNVNVLSINAEGNTIPITSGNPIVNTPTPTPIIEEEEPEVGYIADFGISNRNKKANEYIFSATVIGEYTEVQWEFYTPSNKLVKTATGRSTKISKFINGRFAKYRCRAIYVDENNKTYEGDWTPCQYTGVITKIYATKRTKSKLKLNWNKVKYATKYKVYYSRKNIEKSGGKYFKTVTNSKPSVTIKNLLRGSTYYVKIVPYTKDHGGKTIKGTPLVYRVNTKR